MKNTVILLIKARKPDPYTGDLFGDGQAHILFTKPTPVKGFTDKNGRVVPAHTANLQHLAENARVVNNTNTGAIPVPSPAVSGGSKERTMFDTLDLQDPKTYENPEVAEAARIVGRDYWEEHGKGKMSRGEFRAAVQSGQLPHLVKQYLESTAKAKTEKAKSVESGWDVVSGLSAPGFVFSLEGDNIVISGPFNQDLHERIKRAGGYWDGKTGTNRRVWIVPAAKGKSLKRIFSNSEKSVKESTTKARDEQARSEADRWVGYIEDAARKGYVYENGVSHIKTMDMGQWPDLVQRLEAAKNLVVQAQKQRDQERAAQAVQRSQELQAQPKQSRVLYPTRSMPAFNIPMLRGNRVVVFTGSGQEFRISEDDPSIHGSHLLGHEGSKGAYAYYREATPEEAVALAERELQAAEAKARGMETASRIAAARESIQHGGRPTGETTMPDGEVLHDTFTVYGGGDRFVIAPDWIWYVRNNGMDGDDWSQNNIRTGGAGAIGWRVPYSDELARQIRGQ